MAEKRSIVSATIANGASVSETIDCNARAFLGFVAPAALDRVYGRTPVVVQP